MSNTETFAAWSDDYLLRLHESKMLRLVEVAEMTPEQQETVYSVKGGLTYAEQGRLCYMWAQILHKIIVDRGLTPLFEMPEF